MTHSGGWQPLLTGTEAEPVWQSIHEVAEALAGELASESSPSLAGGLAGQAIFLAALAEADPAGGERWADLATAAFERAVDALANLPLAPSLYSGFSGIAWAARYLEGRLYEAEEESPHPLAPSPTRSRPPGEGEEEDDDGGEDRAGEEEDDEIETALLTLLDRHPWGGDYDLVSGLVGFGVYALESLPRAAARRCLEVLLDHFEELATTTPEGLTWFTPPELVPATQTDLAPHGYYNLGVAHGMPAIIALLGEIGGADVQPERCRRLAEQAGAWLLAQQLGDGQHGAFASWQGEEIPRAPARLAWCYGDAGVVTALLLASRRLGGLPWEPQVLRLARQMAERPAATCGVHDAGICHGAAGLAHLFNRLYHATGEAVHAKAARFWLHHTLDLRQPGEGIAGYLAWAPEPGNVDVMVWQADPGFLTGAAGIALVLLTAVAPVEPQWDRILLASVPPSAAA